MDEWLEAKGRMAKGGGGNEKNDALAHIVFSFNNLSFSPIGDVSFRVTLVITHYFAFSIVEEG